tara:strand:- start:1296 stop:1412 length:117 start_codon:yes stop_codon:yes gene_type:complete
MLKDLVCQHLSFQQLVIDKKKGPGMIPDPFNLQQNKVL